MFNANLFSVLAVHIESKMIIFYQRIAARFQTIFQVSNVAYDYAFVWKMALLLWKFNHPLTSGAI